MRSVVSYPKTPQILYFWITVVDCAKLLTIFGLLFNILMVLVKFLCEY